MTSLSLHIIGGELVKRDTASQWIVVVMQLDIAFLTSVE